MEDGKENLDEDGQPRGMPPSADSAASPELAGDASGDATSVDSVVSRLVDLLYFSQVRLRLLCYAPMRHASGVRGLQLLCTAFAEVAVCFCHKTAAFLWVMYASCRCPPLQVI